MTTIEMKSATAFRFASWWATLRPPGKTMLEEFFAISDDPAMALAIVIEPDLTVLSVEYA